MKGKLYGFAKIDDPNETYLYCNGVDGKVVNDCIGGAVCFEIDSFGLGKNGRLIVVAHKNQIVLARSEHEIPKTLEK